MCFLSSLLVAQYQRQSPYSIRIENPLEAQTLDIDNDGDEDILIGIEDNKTVAWYENRGNNIFGQQNIISDNSYPLTSIAHGDLDNDGDLDVLVATDFTQALKWFENLGNGQFNQGSLITTNFSSAVDILSADLDGDGYQDVLASEHLNDEIFWFKNLGNGTFGSANLIASNITSGYQIWAEDIDLNGTIDVIIPTGNNIRIYKNLGAGVLAVPVVLSATTDVVNFDIKDLNNDLLPDFIFVGAGNSHIGWFENLGASAFGTEMVLSSNIIGARSICAEDLDNDNDVDVVVGLYGFNAVFVENQAGSFSAPQYFISGNIQNILSCKNTLSDMDNDGDIDIVSITASGSGTGADYENLYLNVNNGNLNFTERLNVSLSMTTSKVVAIFDVDNDADNDILRSEIEGLTWQMNEGNGQFRSIPDTIFGGLIDNAINFDVDLDGDQDIVASHYDNNDRIGWYKNLGNGNYSAPIIFATSPSVHTYKCIRKADVDNDGFIDVIVGNDLLSDKIRWHKNINGVGFSPAADLLSNSGINVETFKIGDLDNDGYVDLLGKLNFGYDVKWFKYDTISDIFNSEVVVSSPTGTPGPFEIVDFNSDGHNDLVIVEDDTILLYVNDGNANFTQPVLISDQTPYVSGIEFSDVDFDGDLDVLCYGVNTTSIVWIENQSGGNFSAPMVIHNQAYDLGEIFCVDMDNDLIDDLVVSRSSTLYRMAVERFDNIHVNYCLYSDSVSLAPFSSDTICNTSGLIPLPIGYPQGGTYSGVGVSGNQFNAGNGVIGIHEIVYTYVDSNNCVNSDSVTIFVENCSSNSFSEASASTIKLFPNPNKGLFQLEGLGNKMTTIRIYDISGRLQKSIENHSDHVQISMTNFESGIYYLRLIQDDYELILTVNTMH